MTVWWLINVLHFVHCTGEHARDVYKSCDNTIPLAKHVSSKLKLLLRQPHCFSFEAPTLGLTQHTAAGSLHHVTKQMRMPTVQNQLSYDNQLFIQRLRLTYIKIQLVPHRKHKLPVIISYRNYSLSTVYRNKRCLFSDPHKTHKYSCVGRTWNC